MTTVTGQLEKLQRTVKIVDEVRRFTSERVYFAAHVTRRYRELLIGDIDGPLSMVQVEVRWGPIGGAVSLCDMERFGSLSKHCLELLWEENERKHDAVFGILEEFVFLPYLTPAKSHFWPSRSMQISTEWDRDVRVFMETFVPRLLAVQECIDDAKTAAIRNRIIKE